MTNDNRSKPTKDAQQEQASDPQIQMRRRKTTVTFPDLQTYMEYERLSKSGKYPRPTGKTLRYHTMNGLVELTVEQYIQIELMRPPANESFARIAYYRKNSELVVYYDYEHEQFKVLPGWVLRHDQRYLLSPHMKRAGVPKEQVIQWFQEDAWRTGVVSKEEVQPLIDARKAREIALATPTDVAFNKRVADLLTSIGLNTVAKVLAIYELGEPVILAINGIADAGLQDIKSRLSELRLLEEPVTIKKAIESETAEPAEE